MKINKEWHQAHKMPENPTMEQRIGWHTQHALHCQCRPLSEEMKAEIKKRKLNTK